MTTTEERNPMETRWRIWQRSIQPSCRPRQGGAHYQSNDVFAMADQHPAIADGMLIFN